MLKDKLNTNYRPSDWMQPECRRSNLLITEKQYPQLQGITLFLYMSYPSLALHTCSWNLVVNYRSSQSTINREGIDMRATIVLAHFLKMTVKFTAAGSYMNVPVRW